MIVKCEDLLTLNAFKNIKLMAGENGLHRTVTWPYVGQSTDITQWVHGGELLFITGIGMNLETQDLIDLCKQCLLKNLSGLVLLTGPEYIKHIPKEVVDMANKSSLPLFQMPFNIKLIDVTKEICNFIISKESKQKMETSFLGKLLFSDLGEEDNIEHLAKLYNINIKDYFFINIFNVNKNLNDVSPKMKTDLAFSIDNIQSSVSNLCKENNIESLSLIHGDNIICFISTDSNEKALESIKYLYAIYDLLAQKHKNSDIYLSIGCIYKNLCKVKKSYEEALKALKLYKKGGLKDRVINYSNLGIYRLLFEIQNIDEVRKYHNDVLGKLIDYDKENNTNLLQTLREYLLNNCNLLKTSQVMFIHRNTLIYRLNKIKNILMIDLDSPYVRLDLLNSIVISNYLCSLEN